MKSNLEFSSTKKRKLKQTYNYKETFETKEKTEKYPNNKFIVSCFIWVSVMGTVSLILKSCADDKKRESCTDVEWRHHELLHTSGSCSYLTRVPSSRISVSGSKKRSPNRYGPIPLFLWLENYHLMRFYKIYFLDHGRILFPTIMKVFFDNFCFFMPLLKAACIISWFNLNFNYFCPKVIIPLDQTGSHRIST